MICGGMMSGNCAIGSACIATRPARTVTMAMTMATTGRLMKKRDMDPRWPASVALRRPLPRLRAHDGAVGRRRAFHHHPVTRLHPRRDNPAAADPVADLHSSRRDPVVGPDDPDLIRTLHLRHRTLRNDNGAFDALRLGTDPRILARPQRVCGVRKRR